DMRRVGHDAEALDRFARAYAADHSPIALAQMGLAEQALGRWVESEAHVRGALASRGNAWIEQNRATIEEAYAVIRRHVGTLEILGGPRGAAVVVNGQRLATLPLAEPLRLVPGRVTVVITAPDFRPASRSVSITAAGVSRERIELERTGGHGYLLRPLAFTSAGLAAAAVVTGIVAAAVREDAVTRYNADPICPGAAAPYQRSPSCLALLERGDAMRAVEIAGFVTAGVLAAASATLFYYGMRAERSGGGILARVRCDAGVATVGIACTIGY
ncbi:MAG: hypothetical protein WCJ30_13700, partial [Deltaproteobacteria bacterium]